MKITFIAAMSENYVIGNNGSLPWHLPNDLKHFKRITLGQKILMGRKTFDSIKKALPDRQNYVLTRDKNFVCDGVQVFHHKDEVLVQNFEELFIIGGAELYQLFLDECSRIFLTLVHTVIEGDTYFPRFNGFTERTRVRHGADERHLFDYTFIEYEKSS